MFYFGSAHTHSCRTVGRVRVRCMLIRLLDALLRLFVCLLKRVANIFQVAAATAAACLDL